MNQQKIKSFWPPDQWLPENSVEDAEIALMAKKRAITTFNIIEHEEDNFYVTLYFNWRPELIHLATRRIKTEPRMFKSLDRLIAHVKNKYPVIREINLVLNRRKRGTKANEFKGPIKRMEEISETVKSEKQGKVEKTQAKATKSLTQKPALGVTSKGKTDGVQKTA